MRLVTHNAYWFQGEPSLWGEEQIRAHPRVLQALVRLYGGLGPDVLCLQEVPRAEVADELKAALGMEGVFAAGGRRSGYGGAILWRGCADVAVEDLTHSKVAGTGAFERICLRWSGSLEGGRITVVDVHLSSNRFAPQGRGESVRLAELEALFHTGAPPDVVAGDFNAVPHSRVYDFMAERGYVDAGSRCTEHGRAADQRIDYVWVRADSAWWAADFGVITGPRFRLDGGQGIALSDHHPLWVQLRPGRPGTRGG